MRGTATATAVTTAEGLRARVLLPRDALLL
jgi:hypothetical protein